MAVGWVGGRERRGGNLTYLMIGDSNLLRGARGGLLLLERTPAAGCKTKTKTKTKGKNKRGREKA